MNASQAEVSIVENLFGLSQSEDAVNAAIQELNRDLKSEIEPMEKEAAGIKRSVSPN